MFCLGVLVFISVCIATAAASYAIDICARLNVDKLFVEHVISFACIQGLGLIWITLFLRLHHTGWVEGFGLDRTAIPSVLFGLTTAFIALPFAMVVIGGAITALMKLLGVEPAVQPAIIVIRTSTAWWQIAIFGFAAIILAPVAEEAIFRGVLYPAFRKRGHRWVGLWATAFLFGAIHANLAAFIPLTFLAVVFTWLYERSGNLLAPIAAHSLFNGINFWLLVAPPKWQWVEKMVNQ